MVKNILDGKHIDNTSDKPISYILNTDFLKERSQLENTYKNIIYCGSIDELFDFKFGILNWRSLEFKDEYYPFDYKTSQGTAQTNFVGKNIEIGKCDNGNAWSLNDHKVDYPGYRNDYG